MIRKYFIPILAFVGLCFTAFMVVKGDRPVPESQPVADPPKAPYASFVAGAGLIEPASENVAIGTHVAGVVTQVHVKVGDSVAAGAPLFTIDRRSLEAQLQVQMAQLQIALAQLERLQAMPRAEDLPPVQAKVEQQRVQMEDLQAQLARLEKISDARAISEDDLMRRRFAVEAAKTQLDQVQSQLALLQAGAWEADVLVARAQVLSAKAQLQATETELDRLTVRAPMNGRVLQLKVRAGEFAPAGVAATPLVIMGDVSKMHVRVDVDENDAWRVQQNTPATAYARGNARIHTPLKFVRFEPYIIPKRSLTGESTERVDTRVLQVIFAFEPGDLPLYVGQQMDVYIESAGL